MRLNSARTLTGTSLDGLIAYDGPPGVTDHYDLNWGVAGKCVPSGGGGGCSSGDTIQPTDAAIWGNVTSTAATSFTRVEHIGLEANKTVTITGAYLG